MHLMRVRGISVVILASVLLLGQTVRQAGAADATVFASHRYGYTIVVPASWVVTKGDCARAQEFTAPDQASVLQIAVTSSASSSAAIHRAERQAIAPFGALHGQESFSRWAIHGRSFVILTATVRTSGGLGVVVRVAAAAAGGMLYTFTGAAYPFNDDHGRGVLQSIIGAIRSIHISGRRGTPDCGVSVAHHPATPVPTPAPARQSGGDFGMSVTITPNPVPRSFGHATATVQTAPNASCTAAIAYDNIRTPLGALFGVSPQNTDADGRTSWSWSIDFAVTGGTVTATCTYNGVTKSAAAHFQVK